MKIEQQRREILYCMIEQNFFDLDIYKGAMDKLKERLNNLKLENPYIALRILEDIIHKQLILYLDDILRYLKENEE